MNLFGWVLLLSMTLAGTALAFQPVTNDEAWSLQVARRVLRGERLYRDVFFGAGPIAIWLLVVAFLVSRPQLAIVRALTAVYSGAIATACAGLVMILGASPGQAVTVALATLAFGGRQLGLHNHYGQISILMTLLAHLAVAVERNAVAGILLAVASTGRYSTGIAATGTLSLVLAIRSTSGEVALLLGAWSGGLLTAALLLGFEGMRWFVVRAVCNKGVYLKTGTLGPITGIRRTLRQLKRGSRSIALAHLAAHTLPPLALAVSLGSLWIGGAESVPAVPLAISLAVLAALASFPRYAALHAVAVAPLAVTSLGASLMVVRLPAALWVALSVISALLLLFCLWSRAREVGTGQYRRDLPSLRGLPAGPQGGLWPDQTDDLISAAGPSVFLLDPVAPFFYVCGSLQNPTPFDYPFASTFGVHGQAEVIRAIERGSVPWVWVRGRFPDSFRPVELLTFVEQQMELVGEVNGGRLYRMASPAVP